MEKKRTQTEILKQEAQRERDIAEYAKCFNGDKRAAAKMYDYWASRTQGEAWQVIRRLIWSKDLEKQTRGVC
jgi:hypothetical protein